MTVVTATEGPCEGSTRGVRAAQTEQRHMAARGKVATDPSCHPDSVAIETGPPLDFSDTVRRAERQQELPATGQGCREQQRALRRERCPLRARGRGCRVPESAQERDPLSSHTGPPTGHSLAQSPPAKDSRAWVRVGQGAEGPRGGGWGTPGVGAGGPCLYQPCGVGGCGCRLNTVRWLSASGNKGTIRRLQIKLQRAREDTEEATRTPPSQRLQAAHCRVPAT